MPSPPSPPPSPWTKGKSADYSALSLVVHICQDKNGRVWSFHDFQTPEDAATALGMPQGGTQQVAFALLVEAYRRECYTTLLAELSEEPDLIQRFREGTPEMMRQFEERIAAAAREVMTRTLAKLGTEAAREILTMLIPR